MTMTAMRDARREIDHQHKSNAAFASDEVARSSWYRTYDLRYEEDVVSQCFRPGEKVLDLGCGYGRTTVALRDLGYHVVGIDIVPRMIESARTAHPDMDFRVMDACALACPDEAFDGVLFSFNGIDCILPESRRLLAMREALRVLKPNGRFVFSSHNWLPYLLRPSHWKSGRFLSLLRNGALARRWYQAGVENKPFDCYISTPFQTLRQLRSIGFEGVQVVAGRRARRWAFRGHKWCVVWWDLWPHFVARKPDSLS